MLISIRSWSNDLPVIPYPQKVSVSSQSVNFPSSLHFRFVGKSKHWEKQLIQTWNEFSNIHNALPAEDIRLGLLEDDEIKSILRVRNIVELNNVGDEGYVLIIEPTCRLVAANTETGLYYGLQTLKQLTRGKWSNALTIIDWPSFKHRVIYDDISRGPIPTVHYFKKQIERMAELKINFLSFYIEHVVQPFSHPDFAPANGKLTIPQIKELCAYAKKHHVQLIGSFQSFGHFEKILALPQYSSMGETSSLISPLDPNARKFLADVIGELCDAFTAPYFNVNCDETFDLGKGRSKAYVDSVGPAKFYADHLKFLYDIVKSRGKRMMMWGDIALQHEEVLEMLPKDIIYLTWEYGDKSNFDPWILPFARRNLEFMVCPGILNSYRMFPDMLMAKANIRKFLEEGYKAGSSGAFTTIWDDGGAYLFSGDWYGVYIAADKSWNVSSEVEESFDQRFSITAHGTSNQNYVNALFKLMELRSIEMTYNLNDQVWHQKILPDSGKLLILNNGSLSKVAQVLDEASSLANAAIAKTNLADVEALKYTIGQYKLIVDTRYLIEDVLKKYSEAKLYVSSDPLKACRILKQSISDINGLLKRYDRYKLWFQKSWLEENQYYWLDNAVAPYEKKINDLITLRKNLESVVKGVIKNENMPPPDSIQLHIVINSRFYFKNWMLGGAFPLPDTNLPTFLYSENNEYNVPPSPGDFTHYRGQSYRWQKYSSSDGGAIDLDELYKTTTMPVASYAYCLLNVPNDMSVKAYMSTSQIAQIFTNGIRIFTGGGGSVNNELEVTLPLKKGTNHLLIKLGKTNSQPWSFTFRLDEKLSVTNHKHKYTLNAKEKVYEAD